MITLVTGGSGSGKSSMAELLMEESPCAVKYYLATMYFGGDEESRKKIERHRNLRMGKGFHTIERPLDICRAAEEMGTEPPEERGVLLECLSTLTANEMFREALPEQSEEAIMEEMSKRTETTAEKILRDIGLLKAAAGDLVIVSDNVFEDGVQYDAGTQAYLKALAKILRELAARADRVVEVVAGIPMWVKKENSRS